MPVQGCGDEGKEACHASDLENAINAQKLASLLYDPTGQKQEQNTKIAEAIIDGGEFIVSVLFEPADWAITAADCASGDCDWLMLLGLVPGVPASLANKTDTIAGLLPSPKRADYPWHHLFPKRFKEAFETLGVDINKYLVSLPLEIHKRIHRGSQGGPWNEMWYKWLIDNPRASPEDVFKQAGVMIHEFGLDGFFENVSKRGN